MAEKSKQAEKPKSEGAKKSSEAKTPGLKVREKAGSTSLSVRNAGKAGRLFLLNADGTLDRVVGADEFVKLWNDEKVARSKRGLEGGATQYLSSKVRIQTEDKVKVVDAVKAEFKDIMKLVQDGALKKASKSKIEIIPLV